MFSFDMQHFQHNHGFVALISVLILSAVLLATTLSLAQFGIANRFFILNLEEKAVSERLAEACVHIARVNAYNDPSYEVTIPYAIDIAGGTCTVEAVIPQGNETTIDAAAVSGGAVSNLRVVIDNTDGDFISRHELTSF